MITIENLPLAYMPFPRLIFCSNTCIGGGHLVSIGKVLPILIGKGPKPLIWLQAVIDVKTNRFITIVDTSIAMHPAVRITERESELVISFGEITLLRVQATGQESAIVSELDLRPLGMNIYGNRSQLFAGTMQLSNNTFSGVGTVISLGE